MMSETFRRSFWLVACGWREGKARRRLTEWVLQVSQTAFSPGLVDPCQVGVLAVYTATDDFSLALVEFTDAFAEGDDFGGAAVRGGVSFK